MSTKIVLESPVVVRDSVASQIAYAESLGIEFDGLSAPEVMEIQTRLYAQWQKSDFRRSERESAKAARVAAAEWAKAKREQEEADRKAAQEREIQEAAARLAAEAKEEAAKK